MQYKARNPSFQPHRAVPKLVRRYTCPPSSGFEGSESISDSILCQGRRRELSSPAATAPPPERAHPTGTHLNSSLPEGPIERLRKRPDQIIERGALDGRKHHGRRHSRVEFYVWQLRELGLIDLHECCII